MDTLSPKPPIVPKHTGRFFTVSDLANLPKPQWMVEDMFETNSLVMLAGPPGNYKSFLAVDWALCLATGRSWQGRKVCTTKVLYVLGEGKSSLLKRINAWAIHYRITDEEKALIDQNLRITFDVPQLASKASVDNVLAGLAEEQFFPSIIMIDTLARSFVGMDENNQKDAGMWVESAERLRAMNYTVVFLHHTKKNTEFGLQYRGSSAILGAVDTALTMTKEAGSKHRVVLSVTKQKDHDEGDPIHFRVEQVGVGADDDSIVLLETVQLDSRFSSEGLSLDQCMVELLGDASYETDSARAQVLAQQFGMTIAAAKNRLSRHRRSK